MKILVINCSPVRDGVTAEIVKTVSKQVSNGNEVRTVCIDDYKVNFCKGCVHVTQRPKAFKMMMWI